MMPTMESVSRVSIALTYSVGVHGDWLSERGRRRFIRLAHGAGTALVITLLLIKMLATRRSPVTARHLASHTTQLLWSSFSC
jgi:hypothetical protein